jgi:hypothetical protein
MSNTNTVSFTASIYPRNNSTGFGNIFSSRGYPSPASGFILTGSGGNLGYNWNDQASAYGYDTGIPLLRMRNGIAMVHFVIHLQHHIPLSHSIVGISDRISHLFLDETFLDLWIISVSIIAA